MTSTAGKSLRDQIRERSRFARMRLGQDAPEMVDIPSMDGVRVALVPLSERETQAGLIHSASLEVLDNISGVNARNRAAVVSDVWHACRVPGSIEEFVWDTPEQMEVELQGTDIDYLFDQLTILMDYASPSLGNLTDEEIEDLKKAFVAIDWKDLSGPQASALALCIFRLLPELLVDRYSSSGFMSRLTTSNEKDESISDASTS